jgi:DNA-binding transcriptional MocR family regulator
MTLDPGDYLGKLYTSRPLFKLLFEEAISVLPPLVPDDDKLWELESIRSQRDLSKLLSVSPSTVAIDLVRLENYGWLQRKRGSKRLLGARQGSRLFLRADQAAEAATGVPGLVSREVLGVSREVQESEAEATEFTRGPAREWKPDA